MTAFNVPTCRGIRNCLARRARLRKSGGLWRSSFYLLLSEEVSIAH